MNKNPLDNKRLDKDQLARVEKHALANLDRAQAQWAGASKAALAWLVALVLVWFQNVEQQMKKVRNAQASAVSFYAVNPLMVGAYRSNPEAEETARYTADAQKATDDVIEFPFSIKLHNFPPEWLATLWLSLALGLAGYLLRTRRQVLSLTARGLKLFNYDAEATPAYVRSVVGYPPWWLAPTPSKSGTYLTAEEFMNGLRMAGRTRRNATILLVGCAVALVLMELRVFYVGFCVTSYVLGTPLPGSPGHPAAWLLVSSLNVLLFCAFLFTFWRWLSPLHVQDELDDRDKVDDQRRAFVGLTAKTIGATAVGVFAIAMSTFAFSVHDNGLRFLSRKRTPRGRRKSYEATPDSYPLLQDGLYQSKKTGTIHTASAGCRRCMKDVNPAKLVRVDAAAVPWTAPYRAVAEALRPDCSTEPMNGRTRPTPPGHLHARHRSFLIEQQAVALIRHGQTNEACKLLVDAISGRTWTTKADLRLYDLLAGLSVRTQQPAAMASLIKATTAVRDNLSHRSALNLSYEPGPVMLFLSTLSGNRITTPRPRRVPHSKGGKQRAAATSSQHLDYIATLLDGRIRKWRDKGSRWNKRWRDQSKPIKWSWSNGASGTAGYVEIR